MVGQKPSGSWKRALLNVFIAFHVVGLVLWGLPESKFRSRVTRPFAAYFTQAGLWHAWNMFAPKPLTLNFDVRAQVRYADGSTNEWIVPRMQELSGWERVGKERYRKWRERIRADSHSIIWDDTARWIARHMNTKPGNPPVEVKLTRYWWEIPKPISGKDYQPMPPRYEKTNSYLYATVAIKPMDLQ